MKILAFALTLTLGFSTAFAGPRWQDLASGNHSFKSLGEDFYVDVPVRRMNDSKVQVAFVNTQLAQRLGLDLPSDPRETEEFLKDLFAWEVDPTGASPKKWFATHYQDSNEKGPGSAQGDGRALWTGELKLTAADGSILYVDGVQKGVGATPYAWLNNKTHRDGRQNTNELIISGIRSMADQNNQLDSTSDLVGFTIKDADGTFRSMTLRVGRQTRPAHIRYFSDNTAQEKKMMDYIVKRDLGLPIETNVDDAMFIKWERNFVRNNGEDTARVFALNSFYEHPTMGNKTTTGGSIDLNGRQYLDAYHVNLTHLNHNLNVGDQVKYQRDYIGSINYYLQEGNYRPNINSQAFTDQMKQLFDDTFKWTASGLFLNSLGISEIEIRRVPRNLRLDLFEAVNKLMRATGNVSVPRMMMANKDKIPAAFDTRKLIRGTMAALSLPTYEARQAAFVNLYKTDARWSSTQAGDHQVLKTRYERTVMAIVAALGGKVYPAWITAAANRTPMTRFDATEEEIWGRWAHPLKAQAESMTVSWTEITNGMMTAANLYVSRDLPERKTAMLKPKVHFQAGSCSDLFAFAM